MSRKATILVFNPALTASNPFCMSAFKLSCFFCSKARLILELLHLNLCCSQSVLHRNHFSKRTCLCRSLLIYQLGGLLEYFSNGFKNLTLFGTTAIFEIPQKTFWANVIHIIQANSILLVSVVIAIIKGISCLQLPRTSLILIHDRIKRRCFETRHLLLYILYIIGLCEFELRGKHRKTLCCTWNESLLSVKLPLSSFSELSNDRYWASCMWQFSSPLVERKSLCVPNASHQILHRCHIARNGNVESTPLRWISGKIYYSSHSLTDAVEKHINTPCTSQLSVYRLNDNWLTEPTRTPREHAPIHNMDILISVIRRTTFFSLLHFGEVNKKPAAIHKHEKRRYAKGRGEFEKPHTFGVEA